MREDGREIILGDRISLARTRAERTRGLLGRSALDRGEGLLIVPCRSVHSFFMQFPIDICHLSAEHKVLKLKPLFRPWNVSLAPQGASSVLELPAGTIRRTGLQTGEILTIKPVPDF